MITILLLVNVSIVKLPAFVVVIPNIDDGFVDIGVNIGNIVTFNVDDDGIGIDDIVNIMVCDDIVYDIGMLVLENGMYTVHVDIFYIDIYIGIVMYMLPLTGTLFWTVILIAKSDIVAVCVTLVIAVTLVITPDSIVIWLVWVVVAVRYPYIP